MKFSKPVYNYHIIPSARNNGFNTWKQLVDQQPSLRLSENKSIILKDPITGELITLGDDIDTVAELFTHETGKWETAFKWSEHYITITTHFIPGDELSPVWQTISHMTQMLNGKLIGQKGEEYDQVNGCIVTYPNGYSYELHQEKEA